MSEPELASLPETDDPAAASFDDHRAGQQRAHGNADPDAMVRSLTGGRPAAAPSAETATIGPGKAGERSQSAVTVRIAAVGAQITNAVLEGPDAQAFDVQPRGEQIDTVRHRLRVGFRPLRVGLHRATLIVHAQHRDGFLAPIRVELHAEGLPDRRARLSASEDAAGPDAKPPDKRKAQAGLSRWNAGAIETIEAFRSWNTRNWIAYLGMTSDNPKLSWDPNVLEQTMSNAVGNLFTALGENAIKKGSAAVAGALFGSAAGPAGSAIGFLIGLTIESAAAVIYDYFSGDGHRQADQAAAEAAQRTARMASAKHEEFSQAAAAGRAQQQAALGAAQTNLDAARSQAKVDLIAEDAEAEAARAAGPKNPADLSLYQAMLREWTLEHAGDEEDANTETSDAQWGNAVREVFGKEQIENQKDLFAYQCRAEWVGAGFDPGAVAKTVGGMQETLRSNRLQAGDAVRLYDGNTIRFTGVASPEGFADYVARKGWGLHRLGHTGLGVLMANPQLVEAACTLDLATSDGSCYVDRWIYKLAFTNGIAGFQRRVGGELEQSVSEVGFSVSPD